MDPEELRRKRQYLKAKREKARKKLLLRLGVAGGVLLIVLIFILVMANQEPAPSVEKQETTAPSEPASTTVIRFAATGDLNITERLVASGGADYDFSKTFMDVAPALADAHLTTVNLEGNLCGSPYGASASAPQALAEALRSAGVDMIQLANSYSIHRGISGLLTTIDSVTLAGMEPLGVFKNQTEYQEKQGFSMFEAEGVKIAVVSFTKGMDGTTLPPGNEDCVNVLYTDYDSTYQQIDEDKITQVMTAVSQHSPDITIALLHWGSEYNDNISDSQESIRELLQQLGADAIIGSHPHYVHKIDFDEENGTLVAYSLGDFGGDAPRSGTEYSVILNMEITKDNTTGQSAITGYDYTPIFTVAEADRPIRILRIREAIAAYEAGFMESVSEETYKAMVYALERIESRIKGE